MGNPLTINDIPAQKSTKEADDFDKVCEEISTFVCAYGPSLLTKGMTQLEAHRSMLACFRKMEGCLEIACKVIDELQNYSTGMAVLSEERMRDLVDQFNRVTRV
jgi:hypothetical protein